MCRATVHSSSVAGLEIGGECDGRLLSYRAQTVPDDDDDDVTRTNED